VQLGLEGTDDRVHDDKSVTPTFLFAVLLWPAILRALGTPDGPLPDDPQRLLDASDKVIGRQLQRIALPKRFSLPMRELIMLQTRFERRSGRRALRLLEHPRFRAAYDFLLLRAESGEVDPELAQWWTDLQQASEEDRLAMVENRPVSERVEVTKSASSRRRRPRRRRKPSSPAPTS
jgi:poly(A) polymerase